MYPIPAFISTNCPQLLELHTLLHKLLIDTLRSSSVLRANQTPSFKLASSRVAHSSHLHTKTHKHCDNDKCRFEKKKKYQNTSTPTQCFANVQRMRWDTHLIFLAHSHTHSLLMWANPVSMATSEHVPLGGSYGGGTRYRGHPEREKETEIEREQCAYLKDHKTTAVLTGQVAWCHTYTHKHTPTHTNRPAGKRSLTCISSHNLMTRN